MGELSIKIRIGDREYPMRVDAAEEERLRLAGRLLNEKIKHYREQFGIDDKQDLLAMAAFECIADKLKADKETQVFETALSDKISELDVLVFNALSK
ncbi:MAG TPA: cell division protein ZapA [Cytophagaceae bacterium]